MNKKDIFKEIVANTFENLSPFAFKDTDAFRQRPEPKEHIRTNFALDRDRILYSGAYRRYHGKTQVFSFTNLIDEEMTNRNLHTTYVSQISRTIGKALKLNLELIEAIALGHDLGHCPFGHDGERALSRICREHGIGSFHHNIESLQIVDHIAKKGRGMNLTFQVRDGIISHDGEVHNTVLRPQRDKTEADIDNYIEKKTKDENDFWMPATMEGCVVRISDTIAYIGQDIEDAVRFKILKSDQLPKDCTDFLGNTNSQIIDTLVKSAIINSYKNEFIAFDEETSHYLLKLKNFNYKYIYTDENVKYANQIINRSMDILYEKYLGDIKSNNAQSKIFLHFLNHKNENYTETFSPLQKVRDFIATMTDRYYNEEIKDYLLPWKL
jgi:dGTPase